LDEGGKAVGLLVGLARRLATAQLLLLLVAACEQALSDWLVAAAAEKISGSFKRSSCLLVLQPRSCVFFAIAARS
jgi:hypothetical protein